MFCFFFSFDFINLFKKFFHTPLSNPLFIFKLSISLAIIFSLIALHRESFSTARLPICKDSSMIPLYNFTNKIRYSQSLIDIILGMFLIKNLVKVINLFPTKSICHTHILICTILIKILLCNFNLLISQSNF